MTPRPTWSPGDIRQAAPITIPLAPSPAAVQAHPLPAAVPCAHCRSLLDLEAVYAQVATDRAARFAMPTAVPATAPVAAQPVPAILAVAPRSVAVTAPTIPAPPTAKRPAAARATAAAQSAPVIAPVPVRRPGPVPGAPNKGAAAVARIEEQVLAAGLAPPPARLRPVVTVEAALYRGRVASDLPNADLLLAAPSPGGRAARCVAELLRQRAATAAPPADWALEHEGASADDEARRLRRVVAVQDLRALASLYDLCPTLYPVMTLPPSKAQPINGDLWRAAITRAGSSPAAACLEG